MSAGHTPQALGFALHRWARAGVAMAGVMNDEAKLCFWQGVGDAALALINGAAERLADNDAKLSQQEQTRIEAAAADLPLSLKDLSMADVQKVLTAHRVQLAAHAVPNHHIGGRQVLENREAAAVIQPHQEEAATGVHVGHCACEHGLPTVEQSGIVNHGAAA